jgi:hypothetical protein
VGEIIYNFRAALDYPVCTLSKADTPVWVGKRRNQCTVQRIQITSGHVPGGSIG